MKLETCAGCQHFNYDTCELRGAPISKIRGCSKSPSGRKFFRSRSGKEAYRLNVLGKKGKHT